jgi:hypothetical protein
MIRICPNFVITLHGFYTAGLLILVVKQYKHHGEWLHSACGIAVLQSDEASHCLAVRKPTMYDSPVQHAFLVGVVATGCKWKLLLIEQTSHGQFATR